MREPGRSLAKPFQFGAQWDSFGANRCGQ
jgi:hypothetical protein